MPELQPATGFSGCDEVVETEFEVPLSGDETLCHSRYLAQSFSKHLRHKLDDVLQKEHCDVASLFARRF